MSSIVLVFNIPSAGTIVTLPINSGPTFTSISWGADSPADNTSLTHTFSATGLQTVTVPYPATGTVTSFGLGVSSWPGGNYLTTVTSWHTTNDNGVNWSAWPSAFQDCILLTSVPNILPVNTTLIIKSF